MNQQLLIYLSSLFSVFLLAIVAFWLYREFVLDRFRQKMFALRDEFFDAAAEGKIPFSSNAYGTLRKTMNGAIRFGHRMNFPFVLSLMVMDASGSTEGTQPLSSKLDEAKRSLTTEQAKLVDDFKMRMNFLMVEYVVLNSMVFVLSALSIIVPVVFISKAKQHSAAIVHIARKPLDRIDSVAYCTQNV